MAKLRFSHATLTKHFAQHPKSIAFDETRGLGAYKTAKGISLFVQYRCPNGVQRKKTLALLSEIAMSDARALATKYVLSARHGNDLVAAQKVRETPRLTLGAAYVEYIKSLERKGCSPNTLRLNEQNWRRRLSKFESRELTSLTRADARSAHIDWGKNGGPTVANQCLRLWRTVINFARKRLDASGVTENVASAVEPFKERGKRRVISTSELRGWWEKTALIENPLRASRRQ